MKNTPKNISIDKLYPFEGHPFKVQDNEEMNALTLSIQEQGILSPLIVRPKENTEDEYEIISGHRRFRAAVKAGMKEVPALSQAQRLKALSMQGSFTREQLSAIMSEEKANQKERVKIPVDRIRKYFPPSYTTAQIEETIVKLCEAYHRKRLRDRDSR